MSARLVCATLALAPFFAPASLAQTITKLTNQPPQDGINYGYLLTDGAVMLQSNAPYVWYKLTPDINGSYVNGTWSKPAHTPVGYSPSASSGAILPDGRMVITGGEYNYSAKAKTWIFDLDTQSAVYDPVANRWSVFNGPKGWVDVGDSPATILPDGKLLLGQKTTTALALLDAKTLTWSVHSSSGKADENAEEGFTLMPDGSVLTADVTAAPNAELLDTATFAWRGLGSTVANLKFTWTGGNAAPIPWVYGGKTYYYTPAGEIGPAILRPDGTVFATGAINTVPALAYDAHSAIYTPSATPGQPGTWRAGPNFQHGDDAGDQYAVLLPNGHVLVQANIGGGDHSKLRQMQIRATHWLNHIPYRPGISAISAKPDPQAAPAGCGGTPSFHLYEFDGASLTLQPAALDTCGQQPNLLVLPTGETLIGGFAVYTSAGTPDAAWAPTISQVPATLQHGSKYTLTGTQLTGLSQANAFGDELSAPTNYPLVRLINNATSHVFYCRTHNWTNAGVATGTLPVSTGFDVPPTAETGPSQIEVVANGIASAPVPVTVQ
jgi:hypothetical protein